MIAIEGLQGAATVTRSDVVLVESANGAADIAAGIMCTPQTRFQIASISKQFAALAVMLLVDAGALRPRDSVRRWLPDWPPHWQSITLHHLLTHTSGVRHWDDAPGFDPFQAMAPRQRLALFAQAPLLSDPGATWRYSSPGYVVVGRIVELASGQPYAAFVNEQILAPLALTSTTIASVPEGVEIATGYQDGRPVPSWDLSTMPGTGDMWSTPADLARFTRAIHAGELVSADSLHSLCTSHAPIVAGSEDTWIRRDGYAYGHFIGKLGDQRAYFHTGDNPGYQSFIAWLPERRTAVAVLLNDESASVEQVLRQVLPIGAVP